MILAKGEEHVHVFKLIEIKVLLSHQGGHTAGYDLIKAWKCKCGVQQAFDIRQRVVL